MADSTTEAGKDDAKKRERIKFDPEEYSLRKRLPPRLPRRNNDVYVTNKTDFKAQLKRCEKLLDSGETEIYIHGLGAAVTRAINIALQLKEKFCGTAEVSVNTSTVEIVDDLEPEHDQGEYDTQIRHNSSVHIKVFRTALLGAQK